MTTTTTSLPPTTSTASAASHIDHRPEMALFEPIGLNPLGYFFAQRAGNLPLVARSRNAFSIS